MKSVNTISVVGCHAEGEVGDVITGGVLDIPAESMHEKLLKYIERYDGLRKLLHYEPRGRLEMSTNIITTACDPRADVGLLIMAPRDWVPMSGSNAICTTTVLLETGMIPMTEPSTVVKLDTAAGLITTTAECDNGSCKSVSFDNIAAFVYALDKTISVPIIGNVKIDIAYGGQWYVVASAADLGVTLDPSCGTRLVELGKIIKRATLNICTPEHPENHLIRGINNVIISEPMSFSTEGASVKHANIVTPGRIDRSPCGTGSSSRLAIMHARKQVDVGQTVKFVSPIGTEFFGTVKATTKVGSFDAILPHIKGRAWITAYKQVFIDPDDPFPGGYQLQ